MESVQKDGTRRPLRHGVQEGTGVSKPNQAAASPGGGLEKSGMDSRRGANLGSSPQTTKGAETHGVREGKKTKRQRNWEARMAKDSETRRDLIDRGLTEVQASTAMDMGLADVVATSSSPVSRNNSESGVSDVSEPRGRTPVADVPAFPVGLKGLEVTDFVPGNGETLGDMIDAVKLKNHATGVVNANLPYREEKKPMVDVVRTNRARIYTTQLIEARDSLRVVPKPADHGGRDVPKDKWSVVMLDGRALNKVEISKLGSETRWDDLCRNSRFGIAIWAGIKALGFVLRKSDEYFDLRSYMSNFKYSVFSLACVVVAPLAVAYFRYPSVRMLTVYDVLVQPLDSLKMGNFDRRPKPMRQGEFDGVVEPERCIATLSRSEVYSVTGFLTADRFITRVFGTTTTSLFAFSGRAFKDMLSAKVTPADAMPNDLCVSERANRYASTASHINQDGPGLEIQNAVKMARLWVGHCRNQEVVHDPQGFQEVAR